MPELPFLTEADVHAVSPADAVAALETALCGPLPPRQPRTAVRTPAGQLLLMPAQSASAVGVKLVSVGPDNPARGLPRIQGVYVLFDATTLAPVAVLDGVALTNLRTPAVSALAASRLAAPDARELVVFGTGPQAWGHVLALSDVRPVRRVRVVGRDARRTAAFVERVRRLGIGSEVAGPESVADADLVCTCTSATAPLFDGALVRDGVCVLAVGAHEPTAREVDTELVRRAWVAVEDKATALREAGDVLVPVGEGAVPPDHVQADLPDLVRGAHPGPGRVSLFVSIGMAWEDLAVATAVHRRWRQGS